MYYDPVEFGKRLRELRLSLGLTQEELAEKLNISLNHMSFLERGLRSCSIDLFVELSFFFDVTLDYLILGPNPRHADNKDQLLDVISQLSRIAKNM
ncbi:helix-turn-helix transcriptional regulator [Fournierella massiliensis]|nr:helix-turn-helix transcriptional regulator [Fournierella massiliensis]MCF2556013.1 helix-turn-helix transcriptional regulator [Fournierella massiliensis]